MYFAPNHCRSGALSKREDIAMQSVKPVLRALLNHGHTNLESDPGDWQIGILAYLEVPLEKTMPAGRDRPKDQ
jgi:hypothetical protein